MLDAHWRSYVMHMQLMCTIAPYRLTVLCYGHCRVGCIVVRDKGWMRLASHDESSPKLISG